MDNSSQQYRLEFLVKAADWQEVIDVFKSEMNITTGKKDASDRNIKGIFLIHVYLEDNDIDEDFYQRVTKSSRIALSYDPKGKKIRDDILDQVCIVEHQLRKLLLNISDTVEGYFKYFEGSSSAKQFAQSEELIKKDEINPITSYLTLDDEIKIFGLDFSSWNGKQLTANELLELLSEADDLSELKQILRKKTVSNTIWDQVDRIVLKSGTKWNTIQSELNDLKKIRNKAAHFKIVTQSDLIKAKKLAKSITEKTKVKVTAQDAAHLQKIINIQLKPIFDISELISKQMQPLQKAMADAAKPTQSQLLTMQEAMRRLSSISFDNKDEEK